MGNQICFSIADLFNVCQQQCKVVDNDGDDSFKQFVEGLRWGQLPSFASCPLAPPSSSRRRSMEKPIGNPWVQKQHLLTSLPRLTSQLPRLGAPMCSVYFSFEEENKCY
ncbi:hypothetical protein ANCCAN_16037 [Ancylostoma caninum]|uniref:Uncharacterized protein n=1 Tax=Ancylostoma caninum TaxID=29170 RepID=A0A368G2Y9_ANCCA|nr:hypothetical protein ANCCAN_16037 [Ancylostoma caninum]